MRTAIIGAVVGGVGVVLAALILFQTPAPPQAGAHVDDSGSNGLCSYAPSHGNYTVTLKVNEVRVNGDGEAELASLNSEYWACRDGRPWGMPSLGNPHFGESP